MKVLSVYTEKSPLKCAVKTDHLFEGEPAQNPRPGTFVVTTTAGACEYSHTFVMSASGMTDTKVLPVAPPSGWEKFCRTGPPETRQMSVSPTDNFGVFSVPVGECRSMMFDF